MTGNAPATIALSTRPPAWNLLPIQPGEAAATPIQPNEHTYCIVDLTFSPLPTEVCRGMQCAPHGGSFHSLVRHPPPELGVPAACDHRLRLIATRRSD